MRKHNKKFATRFGRTDGDRSNFPQSAAHSLVKSKQFQLNANALLRGLLLGIAHAATRPKTTHNMH